MDILLSTREFYPAIGGVQIHTYLLARGLVNRDHDVTVYTTTEQPDPQQECIDGITVRRFPVRRQYWSLLWSPELHRQLRNHAGDFDIVHAHAYHYSTSLVACYYADQWGTPFVLTPHSLSLSASKPRRAYLFKKLYDETAGRWLINHTDRFIASTTDNVREQREYGIDENDIVKIPNFIDVQRYRSGSREEQEAFQQRYGIDSNAPVLLFVGRISEAKGVKDLIELLPAVLAERPDAQLVLVGEDDGAKDELVAFARDLDMLDSIVFTGPIPYNEIHLPYQCADLLILPSEKENFGQVLVEAMATETVPIAYAIPSVREVIDDGETGFLVADKNEMASKIIYYLKNPDERRKIEKQASKYVTQYDIETISARILELYYDCIDDSV